MSNRQARRDQMRATRQQRAQQTRQSGSRKSSGPARGGGGGIGSFLSNRFALVAAGVVLILAVILGFVIANTGSSDAGIVSKLTTAQVEFPYDQAKGLKVGSDTAPVKLTQFEDFQCPFCLRYTAEDEPAIVKEYVKTGKVQIEFKHLPLLGAESVRAAKAGECASQQDKFWQLQNELFLTQAKAGQGTTERTNVGRFSDDNLRNMAVGAGVDGAKYDVCFASEDTLKAVQASQAAAQSFGIRGTPGFLINGAAIGSGAPATIEGWRTVLDSVIKQIENPTPSATGSATASASASASAAGSSSATNAAPSATSAATATATTAAAATPTKTP